MLDTRSIDNLLQLPNTARNMLHPSRDRARSSVLGSISRSTSQIGFGMTQSYIKTLGDLGSIPSILDRTASIPAHANHEEYASEATPASLSLGGLQCDGGQVDEQLADSWQTTRQGLSSTTVKGSENGRTVARNLYKQSGENDRKRRRVDDSPHVTRTSSYESGSKVQSHFASSAPSPRRTITNRSLEYQRLSIHEKMELLQREAAECADELAFGVSLQAAEQRMAGDEYEKIVNNPEVGSCVKHHLRQKFRQALDAEAGVVHFQRKMDELHTHIRTARHRGPRYYHRRMVDEFCSWLNDLKRQAGLSDVMDSDRYEFR
jgi:hypothetical protein